MNKILMFFVVSYVLTPVIACADVVLEDKGVTITKQELEVIVSSWPADIKQEAAENESSRESFVGQLMVNKKLAMELDKLSMEEDPELYWKIKWKIISEKAKLYIDNVMKDVDRPNMDELAKEIYRVDKEELAYSPERRTSSHILLQCVSEKGCDLKARLKEAENILNDLRGGIKFEEQVEKYSEDMASKQMKGSLGLSITENQRTIDADYLKALFALKKKGEYSGVIKSQFGLHIIRLDGIEESHFQSFNEVKDRIVESIKKKYDKALVKSLQARYWFSEKTEVNKALLDDIFGKYRKESNK